MIREDRSICPAPKMHSSLTESFAQLADNKLHIIEMLGKELLKGKPDDDLISKLKSMISNYRNSGMIPQSEEIIVPIENYLNNL